MKGRCECDLCGGTARVQCESDEARLCFECDGKVHSANFLVARHPRTLLCRFCGGPTPWRASGPMLGPAASLCDRCRSVGDKRIKEEAEEEEEEEVDSGERDFTEEEEDDDDDDEDEGEEEEQVVPGTSDYSPPPPTVTESSSSSREEEEEGDELATKRRRRENVTDLVGSPSQDRLPCSSTSRPGLLASRTTLVNPFHTAGEDEVASDLFPPLKYHKKSGVFLSDGHQFSSDLASFGSGFPPI